MRVIHLAIIAALGAPVVPAWADEALAGAEAPAVRSEEATCAAILAAARSIGQAPQYRSVLLATWPNRRRPVEREQVVIGDTMYATSASGGRWMKLPMTATDRAGLAAGLELYPPHHCEAADQIPGNAASRVYAYRQDVTGANSALSRMWVDGRDGLPRRLEIQEGTTQVVVTLEYANVKPPDIH